MDKIDYKFDQIWLFIEAKLNILVPTYVKNILQACGFNNGITIALIDEDDIEYFVDQVRNGNVMKFFNSNEEKNILEGMAVTAPKFEFSRGHKKLLWSIVKFLKTHVEENGPNNFILEVAPKKKTSKSTTKNPVRRIAISSRKRKISPVDPLVESAIAESVLERPFEEPLDDVIKKHKSILLNRAVAALRGITPAMFAQNVELVKSKITRDLVRVQMADETEYESHGTSEEVPGESKASVYLAEILCPYCMKTYNVFHTKDVANLFLWKTSNFDRHLKLKHVNQTNNTETVNIESNDEEMCDIPRIKKASKRRLPVKSMESIAEIPLDVNDRPVKSALVTNIPSINPPKKFAPLEDREDGQELGDVPLENKTAVIKTVNIEGNDDQEMNDITPEERASKPKSKPKTHLLEKTKKSVFEIPSDKTDKPANAAHATSFNPSIHPTGKCVSIENSYGKNIAKLQSKLHFSSVVCNSDTSEEDDDNETKKGLCQSLGFGKNISTTQFTNQRVAHCQSVPVLQNGYKAQLGNQIIITQNTCGFDCILSVFVCLYFDNFNFQAHIDSSHSKFSVLVKTFANTTTSSSTMEKVYLDRNIVLYEIYSKWCSSLNNISKEKDTIHIDCNTGIGGFYAQLCFQMDENIASAIEERTCQYCNTTKGKLLPFITLILHVRCLQNLQKLIDATISHRSCIVCKNDYAIKKYYNNLLVLEVEPRNEFELKKRVVLKDLSQTIKLDDKEYILCAVIQHDPAINHFTALVRRINDEWKCYDDIKLSESSIIDSIETNPFLLFYLSTDNNTDFQTSFSSFLCGNIPRQPQMPLIKPLISNGPTSTQTEQKNVTKSQPKPFKPGNVRKINQSGLSSQSVDKKQLEKGWRNY